MSQHNDLGHRLRRATHPLLEHLLHLFNLVRKFSGRGVWKWLFEGELLNSLYSL
ncbi:MAG: hypothetical protein GX260_03375 [Tissierellia bacterium]|nr:hypothetical protein [Tissierellia bacterium]